VTQLTPLQYLVSCAARGRPKATSDALREPPGFAELWDGLLAAARADTTAVTTNSTSDTTPTKDVDVDELLTLDAAAGIAGRSRRTLERRIEAGQLPVLRDGRFLRVRRGDLEAVK
jgi:hypothetical protein